MEETNNLLTEEAARLRDETASIEEKEKQLVDDCVRQLGMIKYSVLMLP